MPQVLINREPLPHLNFDVELLGDCDVIVNELCHRLGDDFEQLCYNLSRLSEITEKPPAPLPVAPEQTSAESTSTDPDHAQAITDTSEDVRITGCQNSLSPKKEEEMASSPAARQTSPHPEPLPETKTEELVSKTEELNPKVHSPKPASPCRKAACDAAEALDATEDTQCAKDEETTDRQRVVEMRRRCWRSRICQSPISKRLGGKNLFFFF